MLVLVLTKIKNSEREMINTNHDLFKREWKVLLFEFDLMMSIHLSSNHDLFESV